MCNAEASDDGLFCGVKDLDGSLVGLVEHYWNTLCESVPKGKKPLMFVLTGDATGGWRGSSITHGEIGIGSFAKGKAISKLAYLPVWLMEGDDSTDNLRARCTRRTISLIMMESLLDLANSSTISSDPPTRGY